MLTKTTKAMSPNCCTMPKAQKHSCYNSTGLSITLVPVDVAHHRRIETISAAVHNQSDVNNDDFSIGEEHRANYLLAVGPRKVALEYGRFDDWVVNTLMEEILVGVEPVADLSISNFPRQRR